MNIGEANDTVEVLRAIASLAGSADRVGTTWPADPVKEACDRLAERAGKALQVTPSAFWPETRR